jgi:Rps23 Pro-64 3,4-dihydroxylase Tpa1-like proline 4-hydroxylase
MIDFDKWESQAAELAMSFRDAKPFPLLTLDGFLLDAQLQTLYDQIPDPLASNINKSRDYMFAKNKYEKSNFKDISPLFQQLYDDLTGARFQTLLREITGEQVFVDPDFHGGGIHQGGPGSFLDMHVDFNFHPINRAWFRNLNILIYLNRDWEPSHKGELKLRHKDDDSSGIEVQPLFNRCVIMFTRDYTVHGYDPIDFPEGRYRRSIAAYAYTDTKSEIHAEERTTVWYPEQGGAAKKAIGKHWPTLVRVKTSLFGSATAKNK